MGLHRRLDHASGQRKEPLVKRPFQHDHLLYEVDDLAKLAQRVAPRAERVEPFADLPLALGGVGLDVGGAQGVQIGVGRRQFELPVRETVAARRRPVAVDGRIVEPGTGPPHRSRESHA